MTAATFDYQKKGVRPGEMNAVSGKLATKVVGPSRALAQSQSSVRSSRMVG